MSKTFVKRKKINKQTKERKIIKSDLSVNFVSYFLVCHIK